MSPGRRLQDVSRKASSRRRQEDVLTTSYKKAVMTSTSDQSKTPLTPKIRRFYDVFVLAGKQELYKRGDLKKFSKSTYKHKKQSSGDVLSKDVLEKILAEKHLSRSLFFNKDAGWKPKTVRSSHWRCSVKKGVCKKVRWCFRTSRSKILYKIDVLG